LYAGDVLILSYNSKTKKPFPRVSERRGLSEPKPNYYEKIQSLSSFLPCTTVAI